MNKLSTFFLLAVILIANFIFAYLNFIQGDDQFYQEHEIVENLQALLLTLSCIFFLIYSFFLEKRSSLILLSFSLLCLTFFLREVDVEDLELPAFLILIGSDVGRNIIISILWALIALFMALDFRNMKNLVFLFLLSNSGILMLICASLLFTSDIFERWLHGTINSKFFEELLELNAYYFLFWSSMISRASLLGIKKQIQPQIKNTIL